MCACARGYKKIDSQLPEVLTDTMRRMRTTLTSLMMWLFLLSFLSSVVAFSSRHGPDRYQAAVTQLVWETLEESGKRPALNLSNRDALPEESSASNTESSLTPETRAAWDEQWQLTQAKLKELGIAVMDDDDSFLEKYPQLLQLDSNMVIETATWLADEFGPKYVA